MLVCQVHYFNNNVKKYVLNIRTLKPYILRGKVSLKVSKLILLIKHFLKKSSEK